ncbi:MAG: serine hydrolase [Emcibacteraceae bacterium]|nr:serine hydrolase [Emcibacteraceae bacterium]
MRIFLLSNFMILGFIFTPATAQTIGEAKHLLNVWLEAQKDYNNWPSLSVSFVNDQEIIYTKSFGYANPAEKREASPNTLYRIASNSKLFTSIAILQLRDRGKLNLNDPINKHLEWYQIKQRHPLSDDITIESLLTHSSGLPYEPDIPYWSFREGYPFPTLEELKQATSTQETLYPAWDQYQYSNLGFMLLGQIIESVSGVSYQEYVHDNIITPMGLSNTFTNIDGNKHGDELAIGYGALDRQHERMEVPFVDAKATTSAAGFSSSANDMAKFAMWQLATLRGKDNKVINHNTLKEMMRPQAVNTGSDMDVGYAFRTNYRNGKTYIGHGGVYVGHTSQITIEQSQKIGAVALMNTHDTSPSQIVDRMIDVLGPVLESDNPPSLKDHSEFRGIYDNQPWGDESYIMQWGDHLISFYLNTSNPMTAMTKFRHLEGDQFIRLRSDGGDADILTFLRDSKGNITGYKDQSDYITKK